MLIDKPNPTLQRGFPKFHPKQCLIHQITQNKGINKLKISIIMISLF